VVYGGGKMGRILNEAAVAFLTDSTAEEDYKISGQIRIIKNKNNG
jgi:hypothetical protein